jgi:hypothetical protein
VRAEKYELRADIKVSKVFEDENAKELHVRLGGLDGLSEVRSCDELD